MTSNEAYKKPDYENDGLDSFDASQLGMKVGAFGGARLLKFVSGDFVTREGEIIGPDREFVSLGLVKAVQKFVDRKLVDTVIVAPEERFPDLEEMNDACSAGGMGDGFQRQSAGPVEPRPGAQITRCTNDGSVRLRDQKHRRINRNWRSLRQDEIHSESAWPQHLAGGLLLLRADEVAFQSAWNKASRLPCAALDRAGWWIDEAGTGAGEDRHSCS